MIAHTSGRATPATLADYLYDLCDFLCRYVSFASEHQPVVVALWIAHAWLISRFEQSPILAITSAEMGSGKTRLLECLELLVPHPWRCILATGPALFTRLDQQPHGTLLMDEVDTIFGPRAGSSAEAQRAILNAGNRRGTTVPRVIVGRMSRTVVDYKVFGPKVVAGIGRLPGTVADRSIVIRMERRAPGDKVSAFRIAVASSEAVAIAAPEWRDVALVAVLAGPDALRDRAADNMTDGAPSLTMVPTLRTEESCHFGNALETRYMADLGAVAGYAIDGTILSLADSTGRVLLTFDAMAPSILDGVWDVTMVNVGNGGVSAVPEGMRATLAFNADGTIEGSDACDSFFGGYSIDGSALAVDSEVGNTPIACDEATNAFAQRYLTALHLATTWAITPDALDLRDGSGALQVEATRAVGQ